MDHECWQKADAVFLQNGLLDGLRAVQFHDDPGRTAMLGKLVQEELSIAASVFRQDEGLVPDVIERNDTFFRKRVKGRYGDDHGLPADPPDGKIPIAALRVDDKHDVQLTAS